MSEFRLTKTAQFVQVGQYVPGTPSIPYRGWGYALIAQCAFKNEFPAQHAFTISQYCARPPSSVLATMESRVQAGLPVTRYFPQWLPGLVAEPMPCSGPIRSAPVKNYDSAASGDLVYFQYLQGRTGSYTLKNGLYYGGHFEQFGNIAFVSGSATVIVPVYNLYGFTDVPGQTGVPAVYPTHQEVGNYQWNSGGQSIASVSGDFTMEITAPADTAAAAMGVAPSGTDTSLTHIRYGLLVQLGAVRAIRNGSVVATLTTSRNAADPLRLVKRGSTITVSVGGNEYSWVDVPAATYHLDASLYRSGDYLHFPEVVQQQVVTGMRGVLPLKGEIQTNSTVTGVVGTLPLFGGLRRRVKGVLPLVAAAAADELRRTGLVTSRLPLVGGVSVADGVSGEIGVIGLASDGFTGVVNKSVGPLVGEASLVDVASIQSGVSAGMAFQIDCEMHPLYEAQADMTTAQMLMVSTVHGEDEDFLSGGVDEQIGPLLIDAGHTPVPGTDERLDATVNVDDLYLLAFDGAASYTDVLDFSFYVEATLLFRGSWHDVLNLHTSQTFAATVGALWQDVLSIRDGSPGGRALDPALIGDTGLEYENIRNLLLQTAVVEETGAVTHYHGYDFTHYTHAAGDTYALRDGRVYRVGLCGGDKPAFAYVDFGESDLGTNQAKRVESLFLGVDTDGTVYAKLTGDDKERVYRVIEQRQISRVRTGKGLAARRWGLGMVFVDPTTVDLRNVEFVIRVSTRRWTR